MASLSQLIVETSYLLGDSAGNRWLTAVANPPVLGVNDIHYLLNRRAEDFNLLSGVYHATIMVPYFSTTPTVTLRDDNGNPPYGPILRLEDDLGRALTRDQEDWLDLDHSLGGDEREAAAELRPRKYLRGLDGFGTLRLLPQPKKDGWLRAFVVAMPVPMLATTHLPWIGAGPNLEDSPAQYHSALAYGAAADALLWNKNSRDEARSAKFEEMYQAKAKQAASEVLAALNNRGAS